MKKPIKIGLIVLLFAMLIAVRGYISLFFYDPLSDYFKREYLYSSIPVMNFNLYFLHLLFRYLINTIISLALIYLFFKNRKLLIFSVKFYIISFVLLCLLLFFILKYDSSEGYMLVFYIRRFLIQPVFVFVLLPAFYYQKLKESN